MQFIMGLYTYKHAYLNLPENLMDEAKAYPVTIWKIECPKCQEEFTAPDDDCSSSASFEAECTECGHKFPARCI